MLDDIRGHDPVPESEEREWIATDPVAAVARVVLIAGVAIMIGVSGAVLLERYSATPTIASAPPAR